MCSTEDDVTMKLTEIVFLNDVIQKHHSTGAPVEMYMVQLCSIVVVPVEPHSHTGCYRKAGTTCSCKLHCI